MLHVLFRLSFSSVLCWLHGTFRFQILHEVDPMVDGLSDDFSETTSKEQQKCDSGQGDDGDDVESGNDAHGVDMRDADDVPQADDDGETDNKGTRKKPVFPMSRSKP